MKKARVFSGLLAVLMIIGLCACSNDNTNSVSSSPENTSTADESGGSAEIPTIRFAHFYSGSNEQKAKISEAIDEYAESVKDEYVLVQEITAGDELRSKIRIDVSSDNLPDVFWFWGSQSDLSSLVDSNLVLNVDEYFAKSEEVRKEDYNAWAWDLVTIDGSQYCIPTEGTTGAWFCNKEIFEEYKKYAKIIKPLVCDTGMLLDQYLREDKKVLFEGAQGAMLDIDYGTYPFVTSSHPGANGVSEGAGIGPLYIKEAIGIIKAYTTRVGSGPFPTELNDATGDLIRERGHEYGTVTERPRRTGWFDAVVVNQSRRMSSLTGISLMLLDVMSGFDTIKICKAYKLDGKEIYGLPATVKDIERCEPVYEELPGWKEDITHVKSFEELPVNCQNYIRKIEELVHCPVRMFSVGPDREQTVVLKDIKF